MSQMQVCNSCAAIPEFFALLNFVCLIFAVIYHSRFQEAVFAVVNISSNKIFAFLIFTMSFNGDLLIITKISRMVVHVFAKQISTLDPTTFFAPV